MKVTVEKFESLSEAIEYANKLIDKAAEKARERYITPGAGQAMEYLAAVEESKLKLKDSEANTPLLRATVEAGVGNPLTMLPISNELEAAQVSLEMYNQWILVGAEIRKQRLFFKNQIRRAASQAEVAEFREQAIQTLDLL